MKLDNSTTIKRVNKIREVLGKTNNVSIKIIAKESSMPETTVSLYVQTYLKDICLTKKIGKEKRVFLITKKISLFEKNLQEQNKRLILIKQLREKGFSYSEIKGQLREKGWNIGDGTLSENLKNVKINKKSEKRYLNKIKEDRVKAGKIGGKIRVSMKDFRDFQISGAEALKKRALERIPPSSKKLTSKKIWLIGHCIFDGSVIDKHGYSVIAYTNKSRCLINQFKEHMQEVYNLSPTDVRKREGDIYVIRYCSIAAVRDINPLIKKQIPNAIINSCKDRKILFLKTFWDDEGAVHFGEHRDKKGYIHVSRYVEAFCENNTIRKQLIKLHKDLGFKIIEYGKKIRISRYEDLKKFAQLINFTKGIFISYPYSRFDGFEKTRVLQEAVASYNKNVKHIF